MTTLTEQECKLLALLTSSVHKTLADACAAGVPAEVKHRTVTPPPQQQNEPAPPEEKKQSKKPVTVYISQEVYTQARITFNATRTAESDLNWSQFVEKAVAGETQRRADLHNGGEAFDGVDGPLSPGRPLSDS